MKIKPWPIVILAVFNFLTPLGNVLLSAHLEKISVLLYLREFFQHGYYGDVFPLLLAPWLAAIAVFAVKEWSFAVFMGVVAFQTANVVYQWYRYPDVLSLPTALALSAINALYGYYFLLPEVRTIYRDKKLRWWEQKPRYEIHLKCRVLTESQTKIRAEIVDLSEGGVLLKLWSREKLEREQVIELRFSRENRMTMIRARVVYARGDGHFGVQFLHEGQTLKFVQAIVHELKKSGIPRRGHVNLGEDFNRWAKDLISKGEGWRPVLPQPARPASSATPTKTAATVGDTTDKPSGSDDHTPKAA